MKKNRMDIVTDLIKERVSGAIGLAQKEFKGTNPYRKVKMTPEEIIAQYTSIPPEMVDELRAKMPGFNEYEAGVQNLIGEFRNG